MTCRACNQPIDANQAYVTIPMGWEEVEHQLHLECWSKQEREKFDEIFKQLRKDLLRAEKGEL